MACIPSVLASEWGTSLDSTTILVGDAERLECCGVGGNTVNAGKSTGKQQVIQVNNR